MMVKLVALGAALPVRDFDLVGKRQTEWLRKHNAGAARLQRFELCSVTT